MAKMAKVVTNKSQNIVKNSPLFSIMEYSRRGVFTIFLTLFPRICSELSTLETIVHRELTHVEKLHLHLFATCIL